MYDSNYCHVFQVSPGCTICFALQNTLKIMEEELGSSSEERYSSCALIFYLRKQEPVGVVVLEEVLASV